MNFQKLSLILLLSATPFAVKAMDISESTVSKIKEQKAEQLAAYQEKAEQMLVERTVKENFEKCKHEAEEALETFFGSKKKAIARNKKKYAEALKKEKTDKERRIAAMKTTSEELETLLTTIDARYKGYMAYCNSLELTEEGKKAKQADIKAYMDATKKELATLATIRKQIVKLPHEAAGFINLEESRAKAALSYDLEHKLRPEQVLEKLVPHYRGAKAKALNETIKTLKEKAKAEAGPSTSSWNPFAYFKSSTETVAETK